MCDEVVNVGDEADFFWKHYPSLTNLVIPKFLLISVSNYPQ